MSRNIQTTYSSKEVRYKKKRTTDITVCLFVTKYNTHCNVEYNLPSKPEVIFYMKGYKNNFDNSTRICSFSLIFRVTPFILKISNRIN